MSVTFPLAFPNRSSRENRFTREHESILPIGPDRTVNAGLRKVSRALHFCTHRGPSSSTSNLTNARRRFRTLSVSGERRSHAACQTALTMALIEMTRMPAPDSGPGTFLPALRNALHGKAFADGGSGGRECVVDPRPEVRSIRQAFDTIRSGRPTILEVTVGNHVASRFARGRIRSGLSNRSVRKV